MAETLQGQTVQSRSNIIALMTVYIQTAKSSSCLSRSVTIQKIGCC